MGDKIKTGGAAFPLAPVADPETGVFCGPRSEGMPLRDWFAGMALSGLTANAKFSTAKDRYPRHAYQIADAMIAERDKEAEK